MTIPLFKTKSVKYLIIFFVVLVLLSIVFVFILNNKNFKQSQIKKDDNPSWLNELLEKEKKDPSISLEKCFYKDKIVYYIPARCCDIPSTLYDENGNTICTPDGGISGKGDGKCSDFFDTRKDCVILLEGTIRHI